ncbi:ROK family transcriptional regulator [Nocardia carnea]|uniref:ROK family protein n=1 Tax=Nocardia carnea TaxID=37328 RepID=A0ABW7TRT0_9NOCA|nr:ROK family transcriptional regulator [Nocardia carnea]
MSADRHSPRLTVQQAHSQISSGAHQAYPASARKKGVATNNLERVFSTIVTVDRPSTGDIAELLGLSAGTVSGLVKKLEERRFVSISDGRATSHGRRPKPVVVDRRTHHTIGFEVSADKVVGVVMNLAGEPVRTQVADMGDSVWTGGEPHKGWVDEDQVVDTIRGLFHSLEDQLLDYIQKRHPDVLDEGWNPVIGIGVSLGGHINRHTGEVLFAPDLRWGAARRRSGRWGPVVRLRQRIRDVTGVDKNSIVVDNDANGRAAAYQLYGGGAYFNDAPFTVVLITDVGVGAAHFIDHEIYRGATGKSLELGNIMVKPDGFPCRCGDRGCLEAMSTRQAILSPLAVDSLDEARELAAAGDASSIRAFSQAGTYLGTGLSTLVDLLDTSRIVLTGPAITRVEGATPVVFDRHYDHAMREAIQDHAYGRGIEPDSVEVVEETGEWNGARGAACLVVHDMITGHTGQLGSPKPAGRPGRCDERKY